MREAFLIVVFGFVAIEVLWTEPQEPLPADPLQRCMVQRAAGRAPSNDYVYAVGMRTLDEINCKEAIARY